jgi:DNA-binding PadR family transcriptional regulator
MGTRRMWYPPLRAALTQWAEQIPQMGGPFRLGFLWTKGIYIYYIVSMQGRRKEAKHYDPLGEFETLVLLAILQLGQDAYGMRIHIELEERAERHSSYGALYTTLDRLEQKGYLSSYTGDPTPERGGRAKKYFQIEAAGEAALKQSVAAIRRMTKGLELLGGAS